MASLRKRKERNNVTMVNNFFFSFSGVMYKLRFPRPQQRANLHLPMRMLKRVRLK
jgi:hypothetical protein